MDRDPLALLGDMLLIRRFEERCAELYQEEQIRGFLHLGIGQEAIAVGVMGGLRENDAVVATHREHAHALARGVDPSSLMAEMFGKVEGCSRGRGGSMHLFDAARRFYGGNAIVGSCLPIAVGLALSDSILGRENVTAVFFGEGAVAEGEFHESMNLAALWGLPVLFCCENNLYAMGTALDRSEAQPGLATKAAAYGVPAEVIDGMDVLEVAERSEASISAVRAGLGPRFIEFQTYRFRAHSMFDPELYRSKDEVASWKGHDPITALASKLREDGILTADVMERLERAAAEVVDEAVDFARAGTPEDESDLTRFVHSEVPAK